MRYRYYASAAGVEPGMRVPARGLDGAVADTLAKALADPLTLAAQLGSLDLAQLATLRTGNGAPPAALMRSLVERVQVNAERVEIVCSAAALAAELDIAATGDTPTITLSCAARLTRSGRVVKLVQPGGRALLETPTVRSCG